MDGSRFDTLTRSLTRLGSRRAAIRSVLAGSLGLLGVADMAAKPKGKGKKEQKRRDQNRPTRRKVQAAAKKCRPEGHPCEGNQRDSCCSGLVCMASAPGKAERCTPCPPGSVIFEGACCTPAACPSGICGAGISDQCGGTITCPGCTSPETCGGRGVSYLCGDPACVPSSCTAANGVKYCGTIGDGCGGSLNCGTSCPSGQTCGQVVANVCGDAKPCTNLCLQQTTCPGGGTTSVSLPVGSWSLTSPSFDYTQEVVPEPGTFGLLLAGLAALSLRRRRG